MTLARLHNRLGAWAWGLLLAGLVARALSGAPGQAGEWERLPSLAAEDFLSNFITALAFDASGRVWVGTDRGAAWTTDSGRTWNPVDLSAAQPRIFGRRPAAPAAPLDGETFLRRQTITSIATGRHGIWIGTLDGLCLADEELRGWTHFLPGGEQAPREIWAVAEHMGEVWVSAAAGLFKSGNSGAQWQRIEGNFPPRITSITIHEDRRGRSIWLAGFDSAPRYGGGPDILRSSDSGRTWSALKTETGSGIARIVTSRVHRLAMLDRTLWACTRHGLARSRDGGESWGQVGERTGMDAEEVFDIALWGETLWAATSGGLYYSANGGDTWQRDPRLRCPVRRIGADARQLWLATSGGLISRTRNGEWRTFSVRSNVLALARTTEYGREVWWAGTTGGLALSRDGGRNWRTLTVADGLPGNLVMSLAGDGESLWAGTDGGLWFSQDGESGRRYGRENGLHGLQVRDIALAGRDVWIATDRGISFQPGRAGDWRTMLHNRDWHALCVSGSTLFAAATDPADPSRMVLMATDIGQENWRALQVPGYRGARINQLLGMGEDVWMATDDGLFRTRDNGETWMRYASETLWAWRVTRLARGAGNTLCVQSVPTNPPSLTAFLNVTRDGGRSWTVLPAAIPGHAAAMMVSGDRVVVGSTQGQIGPMAVRGGLATYAGFERDLRAARQGWPGWNRIAAFASSTFRPDGLGSTSAVDDYAFHRPTLWFGSLGKGAVEMSLPLFDPRLRPWEFPASLSLFAHLDGEHITSMHAAPESMWVGTTTALFRYDRQGGWKRWLPAAGGLSSVPVRALASQDGVLWVGTDSGLDRFDAGQERWTRLTAENSALPDSRITCLAFAEDQLWGGTQRGAFVMTPSGEIKPFLKEERIADVAVGRARQYFASDFGVYVLDREGVTRRHLHRSNSVLPEDRILRVFVQGPDVWAATAQGINKFHHDNADPPGPTDSGASMRGPEGVLVVVNANSDDSVRLGEEYCRLREVPEENLCFIRAPLDETISRKAYEKSVRDPIRSFLLEEGLSRRISFIVLMRGVPLRIAADPASGSGSAEARAGVSLDSELALLSYPHRMFDAMPNPYLHREEVFNSCLYGMYLVTRLDGPNSDAVLAVVRDGIATEQDRAFGSRGFARFDLHPLESEQAERLNAAILNNYRALSRQERLHGRVTPPERTLLPFFRPDSAINTFFFMGWGSRGYDPEVFSWIQGAVAINLDPHNAPSLRSARDSWVAAAVENRVAATIGTVNDPGRFQALQPHSIFKYMKAGYTWAEIAYMSIPQLAWQSVVIGDPLYTPMK